MRKKIRQYWVAGVLGSVGLLLLGLLGVFYLYVVPKVEDLARQQILAESEGKFNLDELEISWSPLQRRLNLNSIKLSCQDSIFTPDVSSGICFDLELPRLGINEFSAWQIYREKSLRVKDVTFYDPHILIHQLGGGSQKPISPDSVLLNLYKGIKQSPLKDVLIDKLHLERGQINFVDQGERSVFYFSIDDIWIETPSLRIDGEIAAPFFQAEWIDSIRFSAQIKDFYQKTPGSDRAFSIQNASLSSEKSSLKLQKLEFGLAESKSKPKELLRNVRVEALAFEDFSFKSLLEQKIVAKSLLLDSPQVLLKSLEGTEDTPGFSLEKLMRRINPSIKGIVLDTLMLKSGIVETGTSQSSDNIRVVDEIQMGIGQIYLDTKIRSLSQLRRTFENFTLSSGGLSLYDFPTGYQTYSDAWSIQGNASSFQIENLSLQPLNAFSKSSQTDGGAILQLDFPKLEVEGIDLWKYISQDQVEFKEVAFTRPSLGLVQYSQWQLDSIDLSPSKLNIYDIIKPFLSAVTVHEFKIDEGNVSLERFKDGETVQNFSTDDLFLHLHHFKVDSSIAADRPFHVDAIDLSLDSKGYEFVTPDSAYAISVAEVGISSRDSLIFADSLSLKPLLTSRLRSDEQRVDAFIPRFELLGLDLFQSYLENSLHTDSIYIKRPSLAVFAGGKLESDFNLPDLQDIDFYAYLEDFLTSVSFRTLLLDQADVRQYIVRDFDTIQTNLPVERLAVQDFVLNESSIPSPERPLYAGEVQLKLGAFTQSLPDEIHEIGFETLEYSLAKGQVKIDEFKVESPEMQKTGMQAIRDPQRYDIKVPELILNGIDLYSLLDGKDLLLEEVQLLGPSLQLITNPEKDIENLDSLASADLYALIQQKLNKLHLKRLLVTDGSLGYRAIGEAPEEAFTADDIYILVKEFEIDSSAQTNSNQFFYAQDINIGIDADNYTFVLPDSTYELTINHLGLATNEERLYAEGISLKPRMENPLVKERKQLWEINIPNLQAKGVNPKDLYFDQSLDLKQVRISRPEIVLTHQLPPNEGRKREFDLYQAISPYLKDFQIDDLFVQQASFKEEKHPLDTTEARVFKNFNVRAIDFHPDSLGLYRQDRYLYSSDLLLSLRDYVIPVPKINYELVLGELGLHTGTRQIYAHDIQFSPKYDLETSFQKFGFVKDDVKVFAKDMKLERLQLFDLVDKGVFKAGHVLFEGMEINALKDRHYKEDPNKRPPMPQDIIRNIAPYVKIDTISIANGDVSFTEKIPDLKRPSFLELRNMQATIIGMTNDSVLLAGDHKLRMEAQTTLMQTGQLEMFFEFPMSDTSNAYRFYGKTSRINMAELNPIIEQTAFVNVADGIVERCFFDVDGRYRQVKREKKFVYRGKMRLYYDSLKVAIIDKKRLYKEDTFDERRMVSFLANTFVRGKNPRSGFLRIGKIYYERESNKGIVGHWVRSLVGGVRSSVGLDRKDARERFNVIKRFKDLAKQNKKKINSPP